MVGTGRGDSNSSYCCVYPGYHGDSGYHGDLIVVSYLGYHGDDLLSL